MQINRNENLTKDLFSIALLIVLHPVIYHLDESRGYFPPDAVNYMVFARDFLSQGLLYLETGLANQGIILPPLYPLLLLIGRVFTDDSLMVTETISSISVIALSVVFFFIIRRWTNRYCAVLAVLVIQVNYQLGLWALTPLTEACFIFVVACVLWATLRTMNGERGVLRLVALGALLSITFFTRQVGLAIAPFILLVLILDSPGRSLSRVAAVTTGVALLLGPYIVTLHFQGESLQADLSAFDQGWSKRDVISIDDVDAETQSFLRAVQEKPVSEYADIYRKRRLLRRLLPDSSAMLQEVDMELSDEAPEGIPRTLFQIWSSLDQLDDRLAENIRHLRESLGLYICIVFIISLITPLLIRDDRDSKLARYLIGGFVLYYLLAISLITDKVPRYVLILVPFVLLHVSVETYRVLHSARHWLGDMRALVAVYAVAIAGYAYSQPMNFTDIKTVPRVHETAFADSKFREYVAPGDPVMSLQQFSAYISGGNYRVMPNDSLEKIALFASREKIPWLLIMRGGESDIKMYDKAQLWYENPHTYLMRPQLLEFTAATSDGRAVLLKFREQ
jgi:4-amino-4-deoxy-L-arabinose transferase-like glycosyltransferase